VSVAEREVRVRTFVDEVWNKRNYEVAGHLYAESYTNGFGTGPAARVEPIRKYHETFPDLRMEIEDLHFEGEKVVREWVGADKLGLFIQLGVVDDPWPK